MKEKEKMSELWPIGVVFLGAATFFGIFLFLRRHHHPHHHDHENL